MLFAVIFEDNPDAAPDIRPTYMAQHLAFLEAHRDTIADAGPLSEEGAVWGGLWLVDAETPAAVQSLIEADPFWPTGLRHKHRIATWRKVFAGGQVV